MNTETTIDQALAATSYAFTWKDKEFKVGALTQGVKAQFVSWCKDANLNGALALRGKVPSEDFTRAVKMAGKENETGIYDWGSKDATPAVQQQLNDDVGSLVFLRLMIRQPQLSVSELRELAQDVAEGKGPEFLPTLLAQAIADSSPRPIEGAEKKATGDV